MTVSARVAAERQARHDRRMAQAAEVVPAGPYCYVPLSLDERTRSLKTSPCPYWKGRRDWPEQAFGYCRLLKAGDSTRGLDRRGRPLWTSHLWDGVKECGVNFDDDPEERAAGGTTGGAGGGPA